MRFPSLFRLPRYQQFEIKPRYYDPIKEEIEERTSRIKHAMDGDEGRTYDSANFSFRRKAKSAPATSMLQLLIAVLLGMLILGWLEFGNDIFYYVLWIIVPGYLFYRLKTWKKRK
ncbi:MAG: hypothetical protein RIM99_06910 [Cyclobacteriaceae bacterium]